MRYVGFFVLFWGGLRFANFWGSGVILRRKKVVRRRYRMLGYSGSLEWYGWMLLCSWVVLKWNKKASFGLIDLIVFMLLLLLCKFRITLISLIRAMTTNFLHTPMKLCI